MEPHSTETTYRLFGLDLDSDVVFPELPRRSGTADVRVRRAAFDAGAPAAEGGSWFRVSGREMTLVWKDFARVRIVAGEEILVDPLPEVEEELLRLILLGPVFSVLLAQRGLFPLHASCVDIGGRAVAIAGASGSGKSVLAAALLARGHRVLADDMVAIECASDPPVARPGLPCIRLCPEAAAWLDGGFASPPFASTRDGKGIWRVPDFEQRTATLREVVVLDARERLELERLDAQSAFAETLRNGYRPDLSRAVLGPEEHLARVARIATSVPMYRLFRPLSLPFLDRVCEELEAYERR